MRGFTFRAYGFSIRGHSSEAKRSENVCARAMSSIQRNAFSCFVYRIPPILLQLPGQPLVSVDVYL